MSETERPLHVVVLDDYEEAAAHSGPWDRLEGTIELEAITTRLAREELATRLQGADVLVVMRERTPVTRELLMALPRLRLIVTTGRSNASIDVEAAAARGIDVCGTPSRAHGPVETTWALVLGLARNLVDAHERVLQGGWEGTLTRELHGRTLGILGLGRIGKAVAAVGQAFGMDVLAWSHHLTPDEAAAHGARRVEMDTLLQGSDVVSVNLRLSDRTRGLLGAREFDLLRPGALLVNTARGPILDEDALVASLASGHLGGVGLDVFDVEPLPADHPLRSAPHVLLSPHLGYVTDQNFQTYYSGVVEDIEAWLAGSPVRLLGSSDPTTHRGPPT